MSESQDAKRKQFYQQLKAIIRPELLSRDFYFDEKRVFHKSVIRNDLSAVQIIEFQLGTKGSAVGKFTVNVGVFSSQFVPTGWDPVSDAPRTSDCLPAMWRRLGFFFDPPQSLFSSFLRGGKPQRRDYWWKQSADEAQMADSLRSVLACLTREAVPWLDVLSCREAFDWAVSELERAKRWKESLGTPGADPHFHLRYYSDVS